MLACVVNFFSCLCFFMVIPAAVWPRRFSPVAEPYRHSRLLGALLWAAMGFTFKCWYHAWNIYTLIGCNWRMALVAMMASLLTLCTVLAYRYVQR